VDAVSPRQLYTAARLADALVYAAGVAGVVAGGLLVRDGSVGFAVVAWALTFVAGAALRLGAWAARALAELLIRSERIEAELARLARNQPPRLPGDEPRAPVDPYRDRGRDWGRDRDWGRGWSGWH
jgi:hypothetical protein